MSTPHPESSQTPEATPSGIGVTAICILCGGLASYQLPVNRTNYADVNSILPSQHCNDCGMVGLRVTGMFTVTLGNQYPLAQFRPE